MPEAETVEKVAVSDTVTSYRNRYALPVGFMVNEETADFSIDTSENAFEVQNDLFAKMTGIKEPLYTASMSKMLGTTVSKSAGMATDIIPISR